MSKIARMDLAPGSPEAVAAGCLCPVIDNCRGAGAYTDAEGHAQFWVNGECPVHAPEPEPVETEEPKP